MAKPLSCFLFGLRLVTRSTQLLKVPLLVWSTQVQGDDVVHLGGLPYKALALTVPAQGMAGEDAGVALLQSPASQAGACSVGGGLGSYMLKSGHLHHWAESG